MMTFQTTYNKTAAADTPSRCLMRPHQRRCFENRRNAPMNIDKPNAACDRLGEDWFHHERKGKAGGETKRFHSDRDNNEIVCLISVSLTQAFDFIH